MASNPAASVLHRGMAGPFSLVIPPTTYCPGSAVEGEVLLKFPDVQEKKIDEVVVELRGTLQLRVLTGHTANGQRLYSTAKQDLVSLRTSLWERGSAYPPPDSHVLRLPFRFTLPSSDTKILSSVSWAESHGSASIAYLVEVIARRPRILFGLEEKTTCKWLTVVSRGDPGLCASIRSLGGMFGEGAGPTWKTVQKEKKMRRGVWGEYSTARVELLIPNAHGILPHCVDIPLLIKIKTTTARLARAKADKHPQGKPIFPAIDFDSSNRILINLRQAFTVRACGRTRHETNEIVLAYIKPENIEPSAHYTHWEADTTASDKEEMGRWVQQWTVQRAVKLQRFPPTFESACVDCAYVMSVHVPFPGLGNDVRVSTPITLDSGIDQAAPQRSGRAAHQVQSEVEERPSARLQVLPTYFDAVYSHGDGDVDGA